MSGEWLNTAVEIKVSLWVMTQEKILAEEALLEKAPVRMVYVEEFPAKK